MALLKRAVREWIQVRKHNSSSALVLFAVITVCGIASGEPQAPSTPRVARITGRVVDGTGSPVPDVPVRLGNSGETEALTYWTDQNGRFSFPVVPSPDCELHVQGEAAGLQDFVRKISADRDIDLGKIALDVSNAYRMPLPLPENPDPVQVTSCDLVKTPEQFNGGLIQLRANVRRNGGELVVMDQTCSASLLLVKDDAVVEKRADQRKISRMIRSSRSHPSLEATITGKFYHSSFRQFGDLTMFDSRIVLRSVSGAHAGKTALRREAAPIR
jgi:Carboxypeptidase regulatory-like domain